MKFIFEDKARNIIEKKGGNLIIKKEVSYSWNGCISRLWSEAGNKTKSTKFYDEYQHQGIKIFIDKTLNVSNQIQIDLKSDLPLFGPSFTIKGVSLSYSDLMKESKSSPPRQT